MATVKATEEERVIAVAVARDDNGWRAYEIEVPRSALAKPRRVTHGNPWSIVTGQIDAWLREIRDRTRGPM
jgi:hypothetical protein